MSDNIKILVYGAKGWIGSQFINILKNKNIKYLKGKERVDNLDLLKKEMLEVNPTHIVSFIGRTHGSINDNLIT